MPTKVPGGTKSSEKIAVVLGFDFHMSPLYLFMIAKFDPHPVATGVRGVDPSTVPNNRF